MRGFSVDVQTNDNIDGILFNLYDNGELVIHGISSLHFDYLIDDPYVGEHTLALSYYRDGMPEVESAQEVFYTGNFTLPALNLTFQVELLS